MPQFRYAEVVSDIYGPWKTLDASASFFSSSNAILSSVAWESPWQGKIFVMKNYEILGAIELKEQ